MSTITSIQHPTEGPYQSSQIKYVYGIERQAEHIEILYCASNMTVHVEKSS